MDAINQLYNFQINSLLRQQLLHAFMLSQLALGCTWQVSLFQLLISCLIKIYSANIKESLGCLSVVLQEPEHQGIQ